MREEGGRKEGGRGEGEYEGGGRKEEYERE